jgi:hypothetical protein
MAFFWAEEPSARIVPGAQFACEPEELLLEPAVVPVLSLPQALKATAAARMPTALKTVG